MRGVSIKNIDNNQINVLATFTVAVIKCPGSRKGEKANSVTQIKSTVHHGQEAKVPGV